MARRRRNRVRRRRRRSNVGILVDVTLAKLEAGKETGFPCDKLTGSTQRGVKPLSVSIQISPHSLINHPLVLQITWYNDIGYQIGPTSGPWMVGTTTRTVFSRAPSSVGWFNPGTSNSIFKLSSPCVDVAQKNDFLYLVIKTRFRVTSEGLTPACPKSVPFSQCILSRSGIPMDITSSEDMKVVPRTTESLGSDMSTLDDREDISVNVGTYCS